MVELSPQDVEPAFTIEDDGQVWDGDGLLYVPWLDPPGDCVERGQFLVKCANNFLLAAKILKRLTSNEIPRHDCEYTTNPESGYCSFCDDWSSLVEVCNPSPDYPEQDCLTLPTIIGGTTQ